MTEKYNQNNNNFSMEIIRCFKKEITIVMVVTTTDINGVL